MKKFQSFEDIANYLSTEELPFTDNKDEIMRNIDVKTASPRTSYRKLTLVFTAILILITSAAFAYDYIYGYIKDHEKFVESHEGEVQGILTDDMGNVVVQIGAMNPKNFKERKSESLQRQSVSNKFKHIYEELEDKLPKDKIALFIPVKDLATLTDFDILNSYDYYDTFVEAKENLPSGSPIPKYIPKGLELNEAQIFYEYEYFFGQDENYLNKLFNEAKKEGKDYYYKEYARFDETKFFYLEYRSNTDQVNEEKVIPWLLIHFKKGETTNLSDNGTGKISTEVIEYNGKEYLKSDDSTYYTYVYIEDQLWTIWINTGLDIEEISKIIESIEA